VEQGLPEKKKKKRKDLWRFLRSLLCGYYSAKQEAAGVLKEIPACRRFDAISIPSNSGSNWQMLKCSWSF
jgi:hypothetical protein